MNEGCFSLLLRVVNIHILVIYTCIFFWYCSIFYEILRLPFWLKSSMKLHFLVFNWQRSFCLNEYIAKIYTKIICNIFSGRCDVHLQVIRPISIYQSHPLSTPNTSFEIRKSLKRMPCLAYTEMDQTKYRVSSMFALFGHCYTYLQVHTLAGLFQTIKL